MNTKFFIIIHDSYKVPLSNRKTLHISTSNIKKHIPFTIENLKTPNDCGFSKCSWHRFFLINFVTNIVETLIYENYFNCFVHFFRNDFVLVIKSDFKGIHYLYHKFIIHFVVVGIIWKFNFLYFFFIVHVCLFEIIYSFF